ncbi:MAG: N-acyl-D-amino-acid deacylase family protein [Acidobacteriaceae bacterium]
MPQNVCTILRNGTVVDGTGAPQFAGDVLIRDDRIVSVGDLGKTTSASIATAKTRVLDCTGCIVAPGFIDAHSHSDLQVLDNRTEKLLQGVTTEVVGNCGFSAYPMPHDPSVLREFANGIFCGDDNWGWDSASDYLASASQSRTATVTSLVGHGSLRIKVTGNTSRTLTQRELDTMSGLLDEQLQQGAAGFSSGLMYAPGSGASLDELVALCSVVARRDGVYATHMRSYSEKLVEAVEEQIEIAEASGCRLQISHLQAAGPDNWPLQQYAVDAIEQASASGVDVAFDVYPWLAGSTVLTQVLPQTALDGGIPQLLLRLRDPAARESIRIRIKPGTAWSGVVIVATADNSDSLVGKSIQEIADKRGCDPGSAVLDVLLEQQGSVNIVQHAQSSENLHALLAHPLAMVVTDGVYTHGRSHPRLYGTFPVLLGEMVRERKWLSVEEAVYKVTGKPAETFHLRGRGRVAEGYVADLVVFDPETVRSDASYDVPAVAPIGIKVVLRNGKVIVDADSNDKLCVYEQKWS